MSVSSGFMLVLTTLSIATLSKGEDCVLDHRTRENSYEEEVRNYIRSNYDFYMQNLEQNVTEIDVTVRLIMRYFSLDEYVFSTHNWLVMVWEDPRIKWNPEDYGGVESLVINFISIPSLRLINVANDGNDLDYLLRIPCRVHSSGIMDCTSEIYYESICITQLMKWPYDTQTCTMDFTPWIRRGIKVNVKFGNPAMSMITAAYGAMWTITDFAQKENVSSNVELRMIFTMEREAAGLGAIIVDSSVILSILTLSCLSLDVKNDIRLSLICFSVYCHFFFLTGIGNFRYIPRLRESVPTILLYYRGSLILTVLAMMLTITLTYLRTKATAPPILVQSCNDFVSRSFARWLVWPRWNNENPKCNAEWTNFANIINSACNIIFVIVYVSMYLAFVPQPIPLNV